MAAAALAAALAAAVVAAGVTTVARRGERAEVVVEVEALAVGVVDDLQTC